MKSNKTPPRFVLYLLQWFCKPDYHADIEGDLIESFELNLEQMSKRKATWLMYRDLLQLFRPGIIKPFSPVSTGFSHGLWKSNMKAAFRSLVKRKEYSIVNTLGLSLGIACSLLVFLYVQHEFSYDTSIADSDQIYKLVEERKSPEGNSIRRTVPYSFARTIPQDFPEVDNATAFSGPYNGQQVSVVNAQEERINFQEDKVLIADNEFITVFGLDLVAGNPYTALKEANSIVLTESTAKRFFGATNPLGQLISAAGKRSVVTGVCKDLPENSHLGFSYLVSSSSVAWFNRDDFTLKSTHLYLKLHSQTQPEQLEAKFPEMVNTYIAGEIEKTSQMSWAAYQQAGNGFQYHLKTLTSLHLSPDNLGGIKAGGNMMTIRILIVIAILIFFIACVNFINLATARSTERAREVGVRKVMGSHRSQLITQFLAESITLSFLSMLVSLCLVYIALPYFNELTDKALVLNLDLSSVAGLFTLAISVGFLAGIYPAFALSAFKPITVLKGNFSSQRKGQWVRNSLVIFQFWVAIILIASTLIIQKQVDYLAQKDLGFDKEQLMVIEGTFDRKGNFAKPFLNEIQNLPEVKGAAGTIWLQGFGSTRIESYEVTGSSLPVDMASVIIGDGLAEVLDLKLTQGEFFSKNVTDSSMILLNEAAVKFFKLKDPVGKQIGMITRDQGLSHKTYYTVKGVVKNFHHQSLHQEIAPLVMLSNELYAERMWVIATRLHAGMTKEGVQAIEQKWKELIPDLSFNFRFLDQVLDATYQSEKRTGVVLSIFSSLSIFISIIGLFALSAYTISMRTKEIGIRKVVGATSFALVRLLTQDFSKMVCIALILAIPVTWYFINSWLDDFAYRIALNPLLFVLSGGLILTITWLTVAYQSLRAARVNPVTHLKND